MLRINQVFQAEPAQDQIDFIRWSWRKLNPNIFLDFKSQRYIIKLAQ